MTGEEWALRSKYYLILWAIWMTLTAPTKALEANIAIAANFTATAKQIAVGFERDTGHKAVLIFGSTGKLYP